MKHHPLKKRLFFLFPLFVFVLLAVIAGLLFFNDQKNEVQNSESHKIDQLLDNAHKLVATSPSKSFEISTEALNKALETGNDKLIIDGQVMVGQILSIQGKNNEGLSLFQQALERAKASAYQYGISNSCMEIGKINYIWGNYHKAFNYFSDALRIAELYDFPDQKAAANKYIGKYYHTTGDFDKSISFYRKSVEQYKKLGDTVETAAVLLSIGKTFINEGNLHMALQCYLDAYKASEKGQDYLGYASICNHLGTIYLTLKQPQKSLEYHRKALNYRMLLKNPEGMAKSFNNLGETYLSLNQIDSAENNFKKSLDCCLQTGYKKGTVKALTNLGIVNETKNNCAEAIHYLSKSLNISREAGYDAGIAASSLAMGNTLLAEKKYDEAIEIYELSLNKSNSSNLTEFSRDILSGLFQCYLGKKDSIRALQYHMLLSEVEIKFLKAESDRQLAELRVTFDSEKKEKDNQMLRKENELKELIIQRKNAVMLLVIAGLAFTILLCFLIYMRFINKNKANKKLEVLNRKILEQNNELETLNKELEQVNREKDKVLSIIAHELRNPLYWFQNLAEVLSKRYHTMPPEKLHKSLSALDESAKNAFHLMDNLLHWSRSRLNRITPVYGVHSLEALISNNTRMYETILRQKEISLQADIPSNARVNVDPDLFSVVIRNLLSNAIKYTPVKGKIDINCRECHDGRDYMVNICDSGVGISDENIGILFDTGYEVSSPGLLKEKGSGFGLKLCKEFVEMNHGAIHVKSETGKGSHFVFTVPKNQRS